MAHPKFPCRNTTAVGAKDAEQQHPPTLTLSPAAPAKDRGVLGQNTHQALQPPGRAETSLLRESEAITRGLARTQESGVDARPCSTPCRTALRMLQHTRPSKPRNRPRTPSSTTMRRAPSPATRWTPADPLPPGRATKKPAHMNQTGEAAATRGGLFPCGLAVGNKSHVVLAAQSRGIEDAGRSDTLETAIFVQNWANHLGPHPAISHSSSYVGKILPLSPSFDTNHRGQSPAPAANSEALRTTPPPGPLSYPVALACTPVQIHEYPTGVRIRPFTIPPEPSETYTFFVYHQPFRTPQLSFREVRHRGSSDARYIHEKIATLPESPTL